MLQEKILESIEKDLPNQVGQALKQKLEQAELDAQEVKRLAKNIEEKAATITRLNSQVAQQQQDLAKHKELNSREEEISKRERELEITILKSELENQKGNTQFAKDVALGLVRNTVYRKNIMDSETTQVPVSDGSGYTRMEYVNNTKNLDQTETEE